MIWGEMILHLFSFYLLLLMLFECDGLTRVVNILLYVVFVFLCWHPFGPLSKSFRLLQSAVFFLTCLRFNVSSKRQAYCW